MKSLQFKIKDQDAPIESVLSFVRNNIGTLGNGMWEIRFLKPRRTPSQNNIMHLWLTILADKLGYVELTKCKRDLVRMILGQFEERNEQTGETYLSDFHTSEMDTKTLSRFMDLLKIWAKTEHGIYLPYFKDAGYLELSEQYL